MNYRGHCVFEVKPLSDTIVFGSDRRKRRAEIHQSSQVRLPQLVTATVGERESIAPGSLGSQKQSTTFAITQGLACNFLKPPPGRLDRVGGRSGVAMLSDSRLPSCRRQTFRPG